MSNNLDRRQFIKNAAAASITIAGVGVLAACSSDDASQPTQMTPVPETEPAINWTEEIDVLVVGAGFAGLAAAIEAKQAGSSVLVIDKMQVIGGNSSINGGDMAAVGTQLQKEAGVEDSVELMVQDMLKAGLMYNHVEKTRTVAEKSLEAVEWATGLGVQFGKLNFHGGHSVPRTVTTINSTGADIVKAQEAKLKELGVEIRTRTKLVQIIQNEQGRVIGIEALDGYKLGDETSGDQKFIKAKKAVVMASGGFSQDVQMRIIHEPRLTDKLSSTNHAGATGEALREVLKLGAMDVHMDWIQVGPWTSPDEKGFGYTPLFCERLVGHSPMIDPETGKRFIQETGNRKVRADAMLALDRNTIIVGDSDAIARQIRPDVLEGGIKNGTFKAYQTLDEIAEAYSIPKEPFLAEIARWNSFVTKGTDDDFNTLIQKGATPTQTAPFYVARLWPKVHHTMGGVVTNLKGQVINQDYQPIQGLYAAGEVTGGTHGAVRLGSCAVTDCIVFGRIAGQEASKEQPIT